MPKNESSESIPKSEFPAGLSNEALFQMLIESQKANAEANKQLAEALLESRKPYVDPKVLEQKARDLEERRKHIQMQQRQKIATKRICPHTREDDKSNIKWMEHSNGIVKGVCGTCFSEFDIKNPEDRELFRKNLLAMRNMGRAGSHAKFRELAFA